IASTILMTHPRRGLHRQEVLESARWLLDHIRMRGGETTPFEDLEQVVDDALEFLQKFLKKPKNAIGPIVRIRESRRIEMSYYRNQVMHLFLHEAVIAIAFQTVENDNPFYPGVTVEQLFPHVEQLSQLLKYEFIYNPAHQLRENFETTLATMIHQETFYQEGRFLYFTPQGKRLCTFLRALFRPFLESYWAAAIALLAKPQSQTSAIEEKKLKQHMQQIAETLYHEGYLRASDSVSMENLSNALKLFKDISFLADTEAPKHLNKANKRQRWLKYQNAQQHQRFLSQIGLYTSSGTEAQNVLQRFLQQL
ncbi:MAG: hypothetical protein AAGJ35_14515, partial [Myxococcota bacterium]